MTLHTLFRDRRVATVEVVPGIETPLRFTDSRVEHTAARQTVGLFDFSFMACFDVAGPEAIRYLERVQTRRVRSMRLGQVAYALLCREDGTVLNDATLWCRAGAHFTLFTGRRADRAHLLECATGLEVEIHDMSATRAACAVQGPLALRTLQAAMPGHPWETLPYFGFRTIEFDGVACDVARVGYTGEAGFEAVTEAAAAPLLWQRLASAGAELGLAECGFEAANALRIEAGFILFSHELAQRATPYELGLGRLVSHPGAFIGARALAAKRWREPARSLVGLLIDEHNDAPQLARGDEAPSPGRAVLTSACRSPLHERWIGLGFATAEDRAPGTRVALAGARRATVARLSFYDPMKRRPRRDWSGAPAHFA